MAVQITNYQQLADKQRKGYQAVSMSHLADLLEPGILFGSEIEDAGALYEFQVGTENAVAGGWGGIGNSTNVYMYIVPAGASSTWIYSTTAPTWDTAKQGWYNGANRCFGGLYKDSGGNYANKWLIASLNKRGMRRQYVSATGATNLGVIPQDLHVCYVAAGIATLRIDSGGAYVGLRLAIENVTANALTIQTDAGGTQTAILSGYGVVELKWNGTDWCKVGGAAFSRVFTSGTGATWKTPWVGSFKVTTVGGGGGGGGCGNFCLAGCGGGGAGGVSISWLPEDAGATFTYTVGSNGAGSSGASGTSGSASTLSDGVVTLSGGGASGGTGVTAGNNEGVAAGGAGGAASGGQINVPGEPGYSGVAIGASVQGTGGAGGSGLFGKGGIAPTVAKAAGGAVAGNAGTGSGSGGSGAVATTSSTLAGGNGTAGIIVIEY